MKRTLSLLLVLTMILCLLSACGGSEPAASVSSAQETVSAESDSAPEAAEPAEEAPEAAESAREDDETTPEEAPEEAEAEPAPAGDSLPNYVELPITAEPITLTLWTTVNPMLADTINSLDQCALWDVLEERTNIHMDGKLISAMAGQEQFQLMMASGDYTDLLDSPGSNYSTGLQGALDDDVLVDLTDVVADCMPNYSAIVATNEEYQKGTRVDDGRIGMIYNLKPETYMPTEGPVIRQDYLDDLGLPSPVTYDDLHDVLVAFRDNYGATMWIPFSGSPLGNYLGAGYGVASTYLTFMSGREPFYQVDGEVKFGVLPIANSTAGSVGQTYELLKDHDLKICATTKVSVSHCLAARAGTSIDEIREVSSHEQALAQCQRFISTHGWQTGTALNTSLAAEAVANSSEPIAAICSEECAREQGLVILERGIADADKNYTRFILVSREALSPEGSDIISVSLSLPHEQASLYRLLTKFSAAGLNLTMIESRPIANTDFDVVFYLDFEGSLDSPEVAMLMSELEFELSYFRFLGNYKEI